ncbi:MAG: hypothetical protein ICV81_18085 [Flavisolibacter sp.]|nr:hypothetical protein [Flavisolibacter sp.]
MQKADNYFYKGAIYVGLKEEAAYTLRIVWRKRGKFAEVKSAIKLATTAKNILKSKGVGAARNEKLDKEITVDDLSEVEKQFVAENNISLDKYVSILNRFYAKKKHKRRKQ